MILPEIGQPVSFLQKILHFDYWLFAKINQEWINPFFDKVLPFMRESELWIPFYLFLLVFITLNFGRKGLWWACFLGLTAILGDQLSSNMMKGHIFRLRPCQDPRWIENIRVLVKYCPVSSSFTSSHACNHFALATFLFLTLRATSRWWALAFAWAFVISYAQVYVGVHYPVDVFSGALLGCGIGYVTSRLFTRLIGPFSLPTYNHVHA
ncbi:MAG: phosphatase PAP2 family protein [Puia sp.]|nr:phosphatase PAP2 family protein [Puia sp.]